MLERAKASECTEFEEKRIGHITAVEHALSNIKIDELLSELLYGSNFLSF